MTLLEVGIGRAGGGTVVGGLRLAGGGSESGAVCVAWITMFCSELSEEVEEGSHGAQEHTQLCVVHEAQ